MHLCEEYIERHRLHVRFARHVNYGAMFFRSEHDLGWRILVIGQRPPVIHPCTYSFRTLKPIHNGWEDKTLFEVASIDLVLTWSEYEDFVMKWAESVTRSQIPLGIKSVQLAAWEILLYCFDGALVKWGCHDRFYKTIDLSNSIDDRFMAMREALEFASRNMPEFYESWTRDMSHYLRGYCFWMEDLIS